MSDDSPVVKATLGERARVLELIRARRDWKPSDISELIRWIESGAELDMPPLPIMVDEPKPILPLEEGTVRKGGRNPPNTSTKRPPAPKGSGGTVQKPLNLPRGACSDFAQPPKTPPNTGYEVGRLKRIIKQRHAEGFPVASDIAVHAALLVSNGWPAQEALDESKRTLDDAEREGGL